MNSLILFPTKQENPFPVGLKLGKVFQLKNNVFLLFTGIGEKGAELLDNFLINNSFDGQIIEFGGAASVLGGEVGEIYEIVEILNDVESVIVHQQTFLKKASFYPLNKNKYEKNKQQIAAMADATLNAALLDDLIKDLMAKYNIVSYVK